MSASALVITKEYFDKKDVGWARGIPEQGTPVGFFIVNGLPLTGTVGSTMGNILAFAGIQQSPFQLASVPTISADDLMKDTSIMQALNGLKEKIRARAWDQAQGFSVESLSGGDGPDDTVIYIVLVAKIGNIAREERRELRTEILREIASSSSLKVRRHVTVTLR